MFEIANTGTHALVAMILPTLHLLTEILDGSDIVS
jgi:hypothetical protein